MNDLARVNGLVMVAVLTTLVAPRAVHADGGVLQTTGVTTAVEVKAQRAVIWQKPDALELTIEPIFNWEGDGAWVIPLPALPEVSAGEPQVLSELDRATAPVFLQACVDYGCCCGGECDVGGGGDLSAEGPAATGVTVWSSGTVGGLDYVVLSTVDGDSLVAWAAEQGFALGDAAAAAIDELEVSGSYFFVARVSPDADSQRALAPVGFRFAPDVAPFYPVRFTGALLPMGGALDVVLWLIAAEGTGFEPSSVAFTSASELFPWQDCGGEPYSGTTAASYEADVKAYFASVANGGFVVEYTAPLTEAPAVLGHACSGYDSAVCSLVPGVALTTDGLKGMIAAKAQVTRLRGHLRGASLEADLNFEAVQPRRRGWGENDKATAVYCYLTMCESTCHCSPDPDRPEPVAPETVGEIDGTTAPERAQGDTSTATDAPRADTSIAASDVSADTSTTSGDGDEKKGGSGCTAGAEPPAWGPLAGLLGLIFLALGLRRRARPLE
jgi:hypothetical protein